MHLHIETIGHLIVLCACVCINQGIHNIYTKLIDYQDLKHQHINVGGTYKGWINHF